MTGGFSGYVRQGSDLVLLLRTTPDSGTIEQPDAAPTYRVYGPSGFSNVNGTAVATESGSITGATNASPIVITSVGHGLTDGQWVRISGVGGNTAANGSFKITRLTADTFSLNGSTGNGSYTSGGTWNTLGLYTITISGTYTNSMTPGVTYNVVHDWSVSSSPRSQVQSFAVN